MGDSDRQKVKQEAKIFFDVCCFIHWSFSLSHPLSLGMNGPLLFKAVCKKSERWRQLKALNDRKRLEVKAVYLQSRDKSWLILNKEPTTMSFPTGCFPRGVLFTEELCIILWKGLLTPNKSKSDSEKDQRTSKRNQRIYDKDQRNFSLSFSLSLDVKGP